MTELQLSEMLDRMESGIAGSFYTRLAQALRVADLSNRSRLLAAFPEIVEKLWSWLHARHAEHGSKSCPDSAELTLRLPEMGAFLWSINRERHKVMPVQFGANDLLTEPR